MAPHDDFYKDLLDNLYDGVYFVDEQRRITYWNKGAERITGYSRERVLGFSCADRLLMHVDEQGHVLCEAGCPLLKTMADGQTREAPVFLHHASGHRVPVLVRAAPIYDDQGHVVGAVETFSDNSTTLAVLKHVDELEQAALQDPLTGLGNRRFIEAKLQGALIEFQAHGLPSALVLGDIDHFKQFNDRYGHDVGDQVLKMVAGTLRHSIRATDHVGRWGGEEFIVILSQVQAESVAAVAEKLRALVESSRVACGEEQLNITISLGATLTRAGDTSETLFKRADDLLYRSKATGRNRVSFEA
jgi:diguanylate cyclase (GGDEF)-like protein/PAS domain S-box-containing protein